MATIIELQDAKKTYAMGQSRISALSSVSPVKQGKLAAITGLYGSEKSTPMNATGCFDALSRETYVLDDLGVSKMSVSEQATVRKMLSKLESSLSISAALARDMLTFFDCTPEVNIGQMASETIRIPTASI